MMLSDNQASRRIVSELLRIYDLVFLNKYGYEFEANDGTISKIRICKNEYKGWLKEIFEEVGKIKKRYELVRRNHRKNRFKKIKKFKNVKKLKNRFR